MNRRLASMVPKVARLNYYALRLWVRLLALAVSQTKVSRVEVAPAAPIWVLGMYRSGTSLTCKALEKCGVDFGPADELVQGGPLRDLNPDGFYENTLFADLSRYWFARTGSTIARPPSQAALQGTVFDRVEFRDFAWYSLVERPDRRITYAARCRSLRHFAQRGTDSYIRSRFRGRFAIKTPQLTALYRLLLERWPDSTVLVVFREPAATLRSCLQLTRELALLGVRGVGELRRRAQAYGVFDEQSYLEYYEPLLADPRSSRFIYFSYDQLINEPQGSVEKLASALGLPVGTELDGLVKSSLIRHRAAEDDPQACQGLCAL
jgi:Sulfotransferase family